MKVFETDRNYNFVLKNGDLNFLYDNDAILSLSRQKCETVYGELIGLPNYGVLSFDGTNSAIRLSLTMSRIVEAAKSIYGVESANVSALTISDKGIASYTLDISTIYVDTTTEVNIMEIVSG